MSEAITLSCSPARIATPAIPRIASATSTSTRDSPRSLPHRARRPRTSDVHLLEDAVHRRHQRDGDESDDPTHDDDDQRLEDRGQLLDLVVELDLVVLRRHAKLVVEGSGLLA